MEAILVTAPPVGDMPDKLRLQQVGFGEILLSMTNSKSCFPPKKYSVEEFLSFAYIFFIITHLFSRALKWLFLLRNNLEQNISISRIDRQIDG